MDKEDDSADFQVLAAGGAASTKRLKTEIADGHTMEPI
jgi:hypothetical protein